ncbi:GerAB/ArcD/ProY family transporter [Desertibacillus haloalkaliphilus]|uniref:GerAB/ArcD/ProY family transporter n=1 Tax=Desertibacillus haloalkaliphilus TaxID=1328930 RepID=UPI001C25705F|nr:GerAB/ArcD/ProY family transporter [Desertibacillus haloalkaliphilus]MBU8905468.1 spore germination protein [Desertibacillus haloalkaliphilus]
MSNNRYNIAPYELGIVIFSMVMGVGILTLPRALVVEIDTVDGWLSIAGSGLVMIILVFLYGRLQRCFPGKDFFDYIAGSQGGRWLTYALALLFSLYFISLLSYQARILAIVVKMYLLDQTPSEVLVAVILLVTTYGVTKGIQGLVHLSLMFLPIIVFVLMVLLLANIPNMEVDRVLPVLPEGVMPVLAGMKETIFVFLGVEVVLYLMMYVKADAIRTLPLNISLAFVTVLYMLVFLACASIFGSHALETIVFPTVEVVKEIEVPGAFFERLESAMITIWIMTIFNTMTFAQLLAYRSIKRHLLHDKNHRWLLATIVLIVFLTAFIPNSLEDLFIFGDVIGWFGLGLFVLSLLIGYLTVWYRKKKAKINRAEGV